MGHNKITWKELDKLNDARHLSFWVCQGKFVIVTILKDFSTLFKKKNLESSCLYQLYDL